MAHPPKVESAAVVDWGLGNYERVAEQLLPAAEVVVERASLSGGEVVVDVGCGTGNAALRAAERGARVTGVDPAERLLQVAAATASERGLDGAFVAGEAADLPLDDGVADVVISVFGVIFAPDPAAAAKEMARISAPNGRILISAWIPEGAISTGVRIIGETIEEVTGESRGPQFPWHESSALEELFGPHGFSVAMEEHSISFTAASPREFVETERREHPMAIATRPVLEESGRAEELQERLVEYYESSNEDPSAFRVTSRYVVAELTR
jgi:SAM-dependent methyltransferase